jgi:hypothetical protein
MSNMKKRWIVLFLIALGHPDLCQDVRLRIGDIEFFGVNGLDTGRIRASLPSLEGREISAAEVGQVKATIKEAITKTTGHPPTDTAFTCCDARGMTTIYIGLANQMAGEFRYNPPPSGATRLPNQAVRLYEEWMKLNVESVQKNAGEDHSKGYALSSYPPLRAKQLAIREYALGHKELLQQVALRSADSNQRAIAIEILGYARRSRTQISTLVTASRDANEGVRNNALRALGVLAKADPAISKSTSANNFIDMLNSGVWTDRNKASHLVVVLSRTRDPRLLHQLRVRALSSLIEMARWRDPGHADDARMILGRAAGLPEEHLVKLIANGDVEQIVAAAQRPR